MLAPPTLQLASEALLLIAILGIGTMAMAHWSQRHDQPVSIDVRLFAFRVGFASGTSAEARAPSIQRHGETAGEHLLPAPPSALPTQHDSQGLRLVDDNG
jgi:hypothetical protein